MNNMFRKKVRPVNCWVTLFVLSILLGIYGAHFFEKRGVFLTEQRFTYGITSKDGVVSIPPTAWLSSQEISISIKSILLSSYLMGTDNDIRVTVYEKPDETGGGDALCGVKRFHLDKYKESDVTKLVNSVINDEWPHCEKQ